MGLFESDENLYKSKPKKVEKKQPKKTAKKSTGSKLIDKLESKRQFVGIDKVDGSFDFTKVDISPVKKRGQAKKVDSGKIVPPINYIEDEQ